MANVLAYSPKEFQLLVAQQDDFGTITPNSGTYYAIDVDSVGSPSLNPNQVLEPRTGSRVLQATDFFQDVKTSIKEISFSGTATTNVLDLLLANITTTADLNGVYTFGAEDAAQSLGVGTTGAAAGSLLSFVYKSAFGTDADLAFKDCVITSLTLNGDLGTEGGRIKFSATAQTGSVVHDLTSAAFTADQSFSAAENYLMSAWATPASRKVYGIGSVIVNSFSCNLENPATFTGVNASGYEVVSRAGEFSATLDTSIKYDATTCGLMQSLNNQTENGSTAAQISQLNDSDTITNGAFGIQMNKTFLTNVAFNEGDIMMLDVSVKAVGQGTGSSAAIVSIGC
tara:strand:- start:54 stop:1076 length:1023 start_codon:yes stop_codon:yes gene_type:complete